MLLAAPAVFSISSCDIPRLDEMYNQQAGIFSQADMVGSPPNGRSPSGIRALNQLSWLHALSLSPAMLCLLLSKNPMKILRLSLLCTSSSMHFDFTLNISLVTKDVLMFHAQHSRSWYLLTKIFKRMMKAEGWCLCDRLNLND